MESVNHFQFEKAKIEKKVNNLRTAFTHECRKHEKLKKTGSGADDVYHSKWFAYELMMFLRDRNTLRGIIDTEGSTADITEELDGSEAIDSSLELPIDVENCPQDS